MPKSEKQLYRGILLLVVALFFVVNVFLRLLSERFLLRVDTTAASLYALTEETEQVLASLTDATAITVVSAEADFPDVFKELLSRYDRASSSLSVQYVDPYENPLFATAFAEENITPAANDILLQGTKGILRIPYEDLLVTENGEITGIRAESELTSGILYVNSTVRKRALFVTGHNEYITRSLTELFTDNRFEVHTQMLTAESLAGTDLVVLAAPAQDITASEKTLLSAFLAEGGALLVFLAPSEARYPQLNALLSSRGLVPQENVVMDDQLYTGGSALNVTPYLTTHEINTPFETERFMPVVPSSRALTLTSVAGMQLSPLLLTASSAYAKDADNYQNTERTPQDVQGPFTLAALSEGGAGEKLFLCGSRLFYADDILGSPSYGNRLFLTSLVNYCAPDAVVLQIPAKQIAAPALQVSAGQERLLFLLFLVLIPLAFLLAGIRTLIGRRRL